MSAEIPSTRTFVSIEFDEPDSPLRVDTDPSFILNSSSNLNEVLIPRSPPLSQPSPIPSRGDESESKCGPFEVGSVKSWVGNMVWRAMNLAGIGESGSPVAITKATLSRISVAVAATNLVIDVFNYIREEYKKNPDTTLKDAFNAYWQDPQGFSKTAKEMVVVGLGVVGWTTGYTFMMEAFPSQKILDLVMRALASGGASGLVSGVGTKLAGQDLNASLRAGLQAMAEGFVWSIVADKNISNIIDKLSHNSGLGIATDSLTVGSAAAAAFGLTGRTYNFFSSQCSSDEKKQTSQDEKSNSSYEPPPVTHEESDETESDSYSLGARKLS